MFAMLMGLKSISPQALHERMQSGALTIIDVNAAQSWLRARVPGALNLGVDVDAAALPPDLAHALVFYCAPPCAARPRARRGAPKSWATPMSLSCRLASAADARLPVHSGN